MLNSRKSPKRNGFTLIELMVAMTITTLIVSVLVSITSIALDTWTRSRAEVRASRQAKAMVDEMAGDFESMITRGGNNFQWLLAKYSAKGVGTETLESSNASDLMFFTAATDRYEGDLSNINSLGDVSCVAYQLKYQDPIQGEEASKGDNNAFSTFVLYRSIVDPDDTFRDLLGSDDLERSFARYLKQRSDVKNFLCENVYQYTITFQVEVVEVASDGRTTSQFGRVSLGTSKQGVREFRIFGDNIEILGGMGAGSGRGDRSRARPTGTRVPTNMDRPASSRNSRTSASRKGSEFTARDLEKGRVTAVEISLTVLTDYAIDQMRTRQFNSEEAKAEFIGKNSYQYSKVVELPKK